MNMEFAMSVLGLSRIDLWYTPAVTLFRLQKAYMERNGEDQKWAKSRMDKITEQMAQEEQDNGKSSGT
jgi:hypothetical protein